MKCNCGAPATLRETVHVTRASKIFICYQIYDCTRPKNHGTNITSSRFPVDMPCSNSCAKKAGKK